MRLLLAATAAADLGAQAPTWDVPHRGALVYDRKTEVFEVAPPPSRLRLETIVQGAADGGHEWRYLTCQRGGIPAGFEQPGFDDHGWLLGRGEFGPDVGKNPLERTPWHSEELCLRLRVDFGPKKPKAFVFDVDHDDGIRIWLNGRLIVGDDGFGRGRRYVVAGEPLDAWQRGDNVLAVQCFNTGGAQYLDLCLRSIVTLPPGIKSGDDVARLLREASDGANRVRGDLFGAFRMPALLLQGDLDDGGRCARLPPSDLRDLAWWIATDLRCGPGGGGVQADAARLYRLGDLVVKGRASPVDAEGWQTIEAAVKNTAEPAPREDSKRFVDRFVRNHVAYGFDGKLVIHRRFSVRGTTARITEFTTDLDGTLTRGKDWKEPAAMLRQKERWTFASARDNQDAEFRALVQKALNRGVNRLREMLKDCTAGDLSAEKADGDRSYHSGRLALGLLALVKGGLPADDEVVRRGFDELRKRALIDTYSLGNALMALEALYAPHSEFGDLRSGAIDHPRPRTPTPADKALMATWVKQLLGNVDTRVDPAYLLRFNYVAEGRFDHSVNQYGLLGLYSAHLCGVDIAATVWEAAANHLIAAQSPGGEKLVLELVDYRTMAERQAAPDGQVTNAKFGARASGWNYTEPKSDGELTPTWGSMTCAGITGLAICQAALQDYPGLSRIRLNNECARARLDGFAWLARNMTARYHAGDIEHQQHWFYYYLYGLERAALLSGIALIQDRDWYFEGAMVLVLAQQDDGNWPPELYWDLGFERNAMAILFLKQSTLPVLTGK